MTRAVGFRYVYDPMLNQYAYASGVVVLTPKGRVARYFYGIEYAPRDLRFGLIEAAEERIGSSVDQVLLLCYQYDPKTGKYSAAVMKSLRLGGVATVIGLAALLLALNRKAKNGRRSVQPASYCFLPFGALLIPCLPERASSFAGDVDAIYLTLVGISVFFIALIAGLEIYFAIKYRRRSPGEIPPKTVPSIPLEVAWIAIPFLICMVMSGQKLFRQLHCATCHKTDGTGRCPVLEGIFGKQVQLQDGRIVTVDESYIRESILDPKAKIAAGYDPIMPNFTGLLSEEQVAQLIAYIESIGGPQQETTTQSSGPKGTVTTGSPSARGTP